MNDDKDYPNTFHAVKDFTQRPRVFEPALLHFPRAFKLGDFLSPSVHERLEWELVRSQVRAHVLRIVAQSRWQNHLVLRGSVLMQLWFGDKARDPKDIDWVFQPEEVKSTDDQAKTCFAELRELVKNSPNIGSAQILVERIASDDIWTYERASGKRLIFPFETDDGLVRELQMDIVWNEPLFEAPTHIAPFRNDETIVLWAATLEVSLVWKLAWLATDMHPQGKDLYDAVLLAEHCQSKFDLVRQAVFHAEPWFQKHQHELTPDVFSSANVDWPNFKLEFPWIEGDERDWRTRLRMALLPIFQ